MVLHLVEGLTALAAGAHLLISNLLATNPAGMAALAADGHNIREMEGRLAFNDAAIRPVLGRPQVTFHKVDPLDDDPITVRVDAHDPAGRALVLAGDHTHRIISFYPR
jgi:hypothetical protein